MARPKTPPDLRQRALSALTRSEKTRSQLAALLLRHGDAPDVEALLDELARSGLQSDARAALSLARAGRRKGYTRARVLEDQSAHGVPHETARAAVEEAFADAGAVDLCTEAQRLMGDRKDTRTALKVARMLVRRGHDPEAVRRACGVEDPGENAAYAGPGDDG